MADDKWTPINIDWGALGASELESWEDTLKALDKLESQGSDKSEDQLLKELESQASCPAPQVFEFPFTSLNTDATNLDTAKRALRKVMFSDPKKLVPHSKQGNAWPTCIHDSMTQYVIDAEITWSDDAVPQKIVAAWVECPKCNT